MEGSTTGGTKREHRARSHEEFRKVRAQEENRMTESIAAE